MINLKKRISTLLALTIIAVLAVVLAGGALGYQYYWLPKKEAETLMTKTIPKIELSQFSFETRQRLKDCRTQIIPEFCYKRLAKELNEIDICDVMDDDYKRQSCYAEIAQKNGDKNICRKISNQQVKDDCYGSVAFVNLDTMLCFNISGERFFRYNPEQKTNWQTFSSCINSCGKKSISVDGISFELDNVNYNLEGNRQYYEFACFMSCEEKSSIIERERSHFPQLSCYESILLMISAELRSIKK